MVAMFGNRVLLALPLAFAAGLLATPTGQAQEQAPRLQIVVNQACLIQPGSDQLVMGDHEDAFFDTAICNLESIHFSHHVEEKIADDGERSHFLVYIAEQEYILDNPTDKPAVFVVRENVPEGWTVDSDPQPTSMDGSTAVFHVYADPGQVVRLHVGMRRSVPADQQ